MDKSNNIPFVFGPAKSDPNNIVSGCDFVEEQSCCCETVKNVKKRKKKNK